jgi:hypothetical protein
MKYLNILIVSSLIMMLTGCDTLKRKPDIEVTIPEERIKIIDNSCLWVKPVYISKNDVLTAGTARQILTLNEIWESQCQQKIAK